MSNYIISGVSLLFILLFIHFIVRNILRVVMEYIHVNKNKSYVELQQYFCEVAYDNVYKDQIIGFASSGYKISGDELETTKRNFVKLVVQLMGDSHYNNLSRYYGSSDTLNLNLLLWFNSKIDHDELVDWATKTQDSKDTNNETLQKIFKPDIGES